MSNYLTGRNANKGECVQACRWSWNIVEDARQDSPMQVMQDERGTYVFNSKDLNLIARLPQLIDCGVDSFKIEGRMKSPYYVATVVNAYRRAIDAYYAGNDICLQTLQKELCKTTHRQFTEGFVFDDGQIKQNYQTSRAVGDSEFLAVVLDYADGVATVQMRSRFYEGQQVEILSPNSSFGKIVPITNLRDVNGVKVMDAKIVQQTLLFDCPFELQPFDILRTV